MGKIEFYRDRTLSERFSASVDFLKQNWKVLYKNVLIGAIPLGIITGFLAQYYQQSTLLSISSGITTASYPFLTVLYVVLAVILSIYLNAVTGAVLKKYGEGRLAPATGWSDLSRSVFSLSGKTFVIGLLLGIVIVALSIIIALIFFFVFGDNFDRSNLAVVTFSAIGAATAIALVFVPSLSLSLFPAYFSGTGNRQSIKIAFGMGFRNWGNVFVTVLLIGIAAFVVSVIFSIPTTVLAIVSPGAISILTFLFSFLTILGTILTTPVVFVFIAFQYFSIVEREQRFSPQSEVD